MNPTADTRMKKGHESLTQQKTFASDRATGFVSVYQHLSPLVVLMIYQMSLVKSK
jgi:hypothetical protein